jgi:hypothetical protein
MNSNVYDSTHSSHLRQELSATLRFRLLHHNCTRLSQLAFTHSCVQDSANFMSSPRQMILVRRKMWKGGPASWPKSSWEISCGTPRDTIERSFRVNVMGVLVWGELSRWRHDSCHGLQHCGYRKFCNPKHISILRHFICSASNNTSYLILVRLVRKETCRYQIQIHKDLPEIEWVMASSTPYLFHRCREQMNYIPIYEQWRKSNFQQQDYNERQPACLPCKRLGCGHIPG